MKFSKVLKGLTATVLLSSLLFSVCACNKGSSGEGDGEASPVGSSTPVASSSPAASAVKVPTITWDEAKKKDVAWFKTDEGKRVADNVVLYQRDTGGWPKNIDMANNLTDLGKRVINNDKKNKDSTFDNGATYEQMVVLARAYTATNDEKYKEAFNKGFDYIIEAQYDNGGWPQFYPDTSGYRRYITYNDNAMVNLLNLLSDISKGKYEYSFVDEERRQKAAEAVQKGIDCILKTQITVNGKKTAWCAQHDNVTLQPVGARSYELPSISGSESVGIVRFLMSIENPSAEIIDAIQSAVKWFEESKIYGIEVVKVKGPNYEGGEDVIVKENPKASPIWARFYEIETNTPFFCGRDGVKKYSLAEIEHERRVGYSWYGNYAGSLLSTDYPAWQRKYAPDNNVLAK